MDIHIHLKLCILLYFQLHFIHGSTEPIELGPIGWPILVVYQFNSFWTVLIKLLGVLSRTSHYYSV